jgi:hypothetical protein
MVRYSIVIVIAVLGCGRRGMEPHAAPDEAPPPAAPRLEQTGLTTHAYEDTSAGMAVAEAGKVEAGEQPLPARAALERKIVYTAEIELVVEDFEPIPDQVAALAKQFDGYLASSTLTGSPGSPRTGQWRIRVPVARYEAFLAACRQLGEVRRVSVDSQEVTEEYYDLEARLRNKKTEVERLRKLLEETAGELEDVLAVERELSRVEEEIERVEGRRRVLEDLTSLTTINLKIDEIRDYVPEEAASYATRVRRGFSRSIAALVVTAQGLSIAIVAMLPWLGVLLVLGVAVWLPWRASRRARTR